MGRRLRDRRLGALIRSNAALRRVVAGPLRRLLRARKPARPLVGAFAHLDRARLVFLYGTSGGSDDHYSRRAQQSIEAALAALPEEQRSRFELRMFAGGPLTTFDGLPPEEQADVLAVVVPCVTALFETNGRPASSR